MDKVETLADMIIDTELMIAECDRLSKILQEHIKRIDKILKDGNGKIINRRNV